MNLFENLQMIKEDNNDIIPDINQRSFIKDMIEFLSDIQETETIPQQCNNLIFDIYDKVLELKDLIIKVSDDDNNIKKEEYNVIKIIEDTQSFDELYGGESIEDVIEEEKETLNNNLKKLRKAQGLIKEAYQLAIQYEDRLDNVNDEKTLKELFSVNSKIHDLLWEADL